MIKRALVLVLCLWPIFGQEGAGSLSGSLSQQTDALLRETPALEHGHVGYLFTDLETGEVLAQQNSSLLFTPASNVKLLTTALALARLGPNYRFQTRLITDAPLLLGQAAVRGLEIVGGGDPNLSGRVLPYQVHAAPGDPLKAVKELADQLIRTGVREINGDVIGVSTRYRGEQYPDGWAIDDASYGYGAPVTALAVNDNSEQITLHPGTIGDLAEMEVSPPIGDLVVLNEVITDSTESVHVDISRPVGSSEVILSGTIGTRWPAWEQDFAVENPAQFAAEAMIDVLRERGITVRGSAASCYDNSSDRTELAHTGITLATLDSPPISEAIQVINKVSQNLHAEMLLREVAYVTRRTGTLEAGLAERELFLRQAAILQPQSVLTLGDGSGLARQDLVSPDTIVSLLRYMWAQPYRELWVASLPVGGSDGTLENRFRHIAGAERVHAKTGSISHINALSGYLQTRAQRWIAFSILVNATEAKESDVRDFMDRLCTIFLSQ